MHNRISKAKRDKHKEIQPQEEHLEEVRLLYRGHGIKRLAMTAALPQKVSDAPKRRRGLKWVSCLSYFASSGEMLDHHDLQRNMTSTHNPVKPVAIIEKDGDALEFQTEAQIQGLKYKYAPLGPRSIRVLVLLPGPPNGRLECELDTHNLDGLSTSGQYTAISYTWNASKYDHLFVEPERIPPTHELHTRFDFRHPLHCGGGRFLISTNLYNLLRRLRHATDGIALWIDAVCINQDDMEERASQVMLMG